VHDSPVRQRTALLPRLAWGTAVALAVLVVLWTLLQPGIQLQWAVDGGTPAAFRIYRAPAGSADFGLLGEVPAEPAVQAYSYVDARLWPAQTYMYRVEAVGAEGEAAASRAITADARTVLPAQLAILLTSLIVGCAAVVVVQRWRWDGKGGWNPTLMLR
jgi:hypothetical protein